MPNAAQRILHMNMDVDVDEVREQALSITTASQAAQQKAASEAVPQPEEEPDPEPEPNPRPGPDPGPQPAVTIMSWNAVDICGARSWG